MTESLRAHPVGVVGAVGKHFGIIQSLLTTCRLHEISPYDYLVDVLQRIDQHPASRVAELTPRLWKERFAAHPLRSDLHAVSRQRVAHFSRNTQT